MKTAGFDLVEILCGTGYLISEFLSPLTNQRTDAYGGSWDNRTRFGLEVVRAVRSTVGRDFPVTIRVNGNDLMPGGNSRRDLQRFTQAWSPKAWMPSASMPVGTRPACLRFRPACPEGPTGIWGGA